MGGFTPRFPPYIFERNPDKGELGLGFRMHEPEKKWLHWPPLPSTQPNPVGIDGVLEGLCPPYVDSMDEAVDAVIKDKYGPQGLYGDAQTFATPFKDAADADKYLRLQTPFSSRAIEYCKEICTYVLDKYGRFPAHVDAFYSPGIWLQFSHLELEYYNRFYKPELVSRQRAHDATWGHDAVDDDDGQ